MNHVIRTTVMLPEETHERLRRLAKRRGVPLATVIRDALNEVADAAKPKPPSFIGAVSIDAGDFAASTAETLPPIPPPVSHASPEELEELRRTADKMARHRSP
jgi:predicted transcriptional regulator